MVRALDSQFRIPGKPVRGSKVDSVFHSFEVNQIRTRNSWRLTDQNLTASSQDLVDLSLETIESYS